MSLSGSSTYGNVFISKLPEATTTAGALPTGSIIVSRLADGSVTLLPSASVPQLPVAVIADISAYAELNALLVSGETMSAAMTGFGSMTAQARAIVQAALDMTASGGLIALSSVKLEAMSSSDGILSFSVSVPQYSQITSEATLEFSTVEVHTSSAEFFEELEFSVEASAIATIEGPHFTAEGSFTADAVADGGTVVIPTPMTSEAFFSADASSSVSAKISSESELLISALAAFLRGADVEVSANFTAQAVPVEMRTATIFSSAILTVEAVQKGFPYTLPFSLAAPEDE